MWGGDLGISSGKVLEKLRRREERGRLTLFGGRQEVVAASEGDAEVVVLGETITLEHVGPGETEGGHDWSAAVLHLHAERVAGLDDFVQVIEAHRGKERAQELLGVRVALLHDQGDPGARLLQHLLHGLVAQQVGQPHVLVLDAVAQLQVGRDGLAVAALVGEVGLPEEQPARRAPAAVRGEGQQQQRAGALRHGGRATPGAGGAERGKREAARPELVPGPLLARSLGAAPGPGKWAAGRPERGEAGRGQDGAGEDLSARLRAASPGSAPGGSDPGEQCVQLLGPSQSFLGLFNANLEAGGAREEPAESNLRRVGHYSLGLGFPLRMPPLRSLEGNSGCPHDPLKVRPGARSRSAYHKQIDQPGNCAPTVSVRGAGCERSGDPGDSMGGLASRSRRKCTQPPSSEDAYPPSPLRGPDQGLFDPHSVVSVLTRGFPGELHLPAPARRHPGLCAFSLHLGPVRPSPTQLPTWPTPYVCSSLTF